MAKSVCCKCGHDKFEMVDSFRSDLKFIQCAECGAVVTAADDINFQEKFNTIIKNEQALEHIMN